MNPRVVVFSLAILLAASSGVYAFEGAVTDSTLKGAPTSALAANPELAALLKKKTKTGNQIKVMDGMGEHKGELIQISDTALDIDVETEAAYIPRTIPFLDLESVWKRNSNAGAGALIGGTVGLVVGVMLGAATHDDAFSDRSANMVGGGILCAILGTGIGAIIGSQVHSYDLIYTQ